MLLFFRRRKSVCDEEISLESEFNCRLQVSNYKIRLGPLIDTSPSHCSLGDSSHVSKRCLK